MEQGETGVKPTGMDIRGEEELDHSNMILKKLVDMLAPGANMPKKATRTIGVGQAGASVTRICCG